MTYNPTPEQMEQDRIAMEMGLPPPNAPIVTETSPPTTTVTPPAETAPLITEPSPLTPAQQADVTKQIEYWESQVRQGEELLKSSDTELDHPLDRAQVQKEIDSYQAKADLLRQTQQGYELTPQIALITDPKLQAFVTVSKDGTYDVDVSGIIRTGMDPMQVKQLGITDESIGQVKALNKLIGYKTAGGGYNIGKAIEGGKEDVLFEAGFTKEQIDSIKKQMEIQKELIQKQKETQFEQRLPHNVKDIIDEYKLGNGYDIAKWLRDHPNTENYLESEDFSKEAIEEAKAYNAQPWRRTTAQDRLYLTAYHIGLDMTGQQSPEEMEKALSKDPSFLNLPSTEPKIIGLKTTMSERAFVDNFVASRIDQPEYSSLGNKSTVTAILKDLAHGEYMRLYGKGTSLASQGTDVLTVIAPAAKALHPEYKFRDVTGAEWALSAANVALLVVTPVLGKVAGAGIKVISGIKTAVETGAALTYPVVTAVQWSEMSTTERIISVAIDTTIAGAVLGKPVMSAFKQLVPGIGFEKRVEALARATKSGDATEVWIAGDRLESYGRALEKARVSGGVRISKQGKFIKENASAIAQSSSVGRISELDPIINDLRAINEEMAILRQRGALAIDAKTGKIYDTETGEEMTLARQTERIRTARETRVGTLPITRAEAEALGLTDDEIAEIFKEVGNDRELFLKLAREKAAKNAKAMDMWNKTLEESAKKYEAKKTADGKTVSPEEEAAERWGEESANLQDTLRQVKQMNKEAAKREAERIVAIEQAAREVSRERAYRILFPSRVGGRVAEEAAQPEPERIDATTHQPMPVPIVNPVTREVEAPSTKQFEKPVTTVAPSVVEQEETETKTAVYPYPETETQTKTKVAPQTQTQTATQTKTQTKTQVQPQTQTQTKTVTQTETTAPPTTSTGGGGGGGEGGGGEGGGGGDGGEPKPKPKPRLRFGGGGEKPIKLPTGTVMRKQGFGFWIKEPGKSPYFTRKQPAEYHDTLSNSPYDTIQVVGGKAPGKLPKQDMGIVDVYVKNPPLYPRHSNRQAIRFPRDPQFTNKPKRQRQSTVTVRNTKEGPYYRAGGMVSRKPIGRRKRI